MFSYLLESNEFCMIAHSWGRAREVEGFRTIEFSLDKNELFNVDGHFKTQNQLKNSRNLQTQVGRIFYEPRSNQILSTTISDDRWAKIMEARDDQTIQGNFIRTVLQALNGDRPVVQPIAIREGRISR